MSVKLLGQASDSKDASLKAVVGYRAGVVLLAGALTTALLQGCSRRSSSVATSSPTVSASPSASPQASATPKAQSSLPNYDEIIAKTAQMQTHGLTQQARVDLVMEHLVKLGRKRMLANWEISQLTPTLFEVTYSIAPIDQVVAIANQQQAVQRPSSDPFSRPAKPPRPADGIYFTWTADVSKGTIVPTNPSAKALQELKPKLEEGNLSVTISTPEEAVTSVATPVVRESSPGMTFVGFEGSGNARVAVVSLSGQYRQFSLGDNLEGRRFSKIGDHDIELTVGSQVVTLAPGQTIP